MSDALTKLAEGERLLAAFRSAVRAKDNPRDIEAAWGAVVDWFADRNADALLAGMRALVEMTQVSELTYDRPSVRIMRLMLKSAQDAVAAFTKEEA